MRLAPLARRAYSYKVTSPPGNMAVSLTTVKLYLKITSITEDAILNIFIQAATDYAEQNTRRDFITRTYETFRDFFSDSVSEGYYTFGNVPTLNNLAINGGGNVGFEIRRSILQSIDSIQYLVDGLFITVDSSTFYNTIETDYSEVLTVDGADWPDNADRQLQAIIITFKTGFGDDDTDMPPWVTEGILQHVANMWANRGDCSTCGDSTGMLLPSTAKLLYMQNRIENL